MAKKVVNYKKLDFEINYEIINQNKNETIVVLHGWGSNKEIMKQAFSDLSTEYKLIFIDMPGFGKSPNENMVLNTADYANIMQLFLENENVICAIGHSFGGKVAALLNCTNLVLLSTSGILEQKPFKIRAKIAIFKLLKPFGGSKLRKYFASNDANQMNQFMYETFKNVVNEDFEPFFKACKSNTLIIWGKDDTATSIESGIKISKIINNSKFFPLEGDHYFFLKNKNIVCDIISKNLI